MLPLTDFTILAAIYLVIEVIGLLLAADAVMRSRSSQGAVAWLFSLAAMPVIARRRGPARPRCPRCPPPRRARGKGGLARRGEPGGTCERGTPWHLPQTAQPALDEVVLGEEHGGVGDVPRMPFPLD